MVSKASEDLPEPDSPVMTTSCSRGRSSETFFRLCSRAPRMEMNLEVILSVMSAWPRPCARLSPQWVRGQGEGCVVSPCESDGSLPPPRGEVRRRLRRRGGGPSSTQGFSPHPADSKLSAALPIKGRDG